ALGGLGVYSFGMGESWADATKRDAPKKSLAKPAPLIDRAPLPKPKLVMLDPGHGGRDPGALGGRGTPEKSVVIAVARELQRELLAGGRYRVLLTRASDSY